MANADGSVVIEVKIDDKDGEKELNRLESKIRRMQEKMFVGNNVKDQLSAKLASAREELESWQRQVAEGSKTSESISQITRLNDEIASLEAQLKKQNASLERTGIELNATAKYYTDLREKMNQASIEAAEAAGKTTDVSSAVEGAGGKVSELTAKMRELGSEAASSMKIGLQGIAAGISKAFSTAAKAVATAGKSILRTVGKLATTAFSKLRGITSRGGSGGVLPSLKTILKYSLGIRSMYIGVRKLMTAVGEGLKNMAQYSSRVNKAISKLKSAMTQLKNSLAAMVAPVLTVVAPILERLISLLANAANSVARFTALLLGQKTYIKATKVQEDYAASLEGTAGAAKDAQKSLANFDEINQLSDNSSSGAASGVSASDMFELAEVGEPAFASWGEAFSAMLDNLRNNAIPKLKSILESMADWVNTFSANLYQMFAFPGISEKILLLADDLAGALNGMVSRINWKTLGGAIGAGLNLALTSLRTFLYSFDWMNLGSSLAAMMNQTFAEIDWYNVGALLWAKFKIALETLGSFLSDINASGLAQAASNVVMGFFDEVSNTLQSVDWQRLGDQAATFLANIDWSGLATSVFRAIGSAFGAAAGFLWGLIKNVWDGIIQWWRDSAFEDGKFTLLGLLEGIWEGIKNIGKWIYEHILKPFITGFKDAFGIHSPSKVMAEQGGYIMSGLLEGISAGLAPILSVFNGLLASIKEILGGVITFISGVFSGDWEKAWDGIKNIFKGIVNGIISIFEGMINLIVRGLNWFIRQLNKISFDIPEWVPVIGGKRFGFNIPMIGETQLPRLAQGAVIPPNREFLAVLGDQKQGTNIETPLSTMVEAFKQALAESGGGSSNRPIYLMLDRRELGRAVLEVGDQERVRVGVSLT